MGTEQTQGSPGSSFEKIRLEIEKFDFRKVQDLLAQDQTISDPVQDLIREFKLFFALKAFYKDVNAEMLYPSFNKTFAEYNLKEGSDLEMVL